MTGPNEHGVYTPSKDDWQPLELPAGAPVRGSVALVRTEAGWCWGYLFHCTDRVCSGVADPSYSRCAPTREEAVAAATREVLRGIRWQGEFTVPAPWQPCRPVSVPAGGVQLGLFEGVG